MASAHAPKPAPRVRWPDFNRKAEIAWVQQKRITMLAELILAEKQLLAERISATRKLFRRKVLLCDVHSHTPFSDGVSTIAENKAMADLLGLDFLFITDHRTLRHRRYCDAKAGLGWGQEPPTRDMEVGLLLNDRVFVPQCDNVAADFLRARKAAPFAWIPHPTGYGRSHWYPDEVVRNLWRLGDRFTMEVLNGASKISRAYNAISAKAVSVWDRLLRAGRQVSVLGASDAHICQSIGTAWTGVYSARRHAKTVVAALGRGHCVATEAPLLWLSCDRKMMGDEVRRKPGTKLSIRFVAADAVGLQSVRLISAGRVIKQVRAKGLPRIAGVHTCRVGRKPSYIRLECAALDDRRAFSSPLFIRPL